MLAVKINFRSRRPIYLQIGDQVRQMIVSGQLQPGDQLPTVRQLAGVLQVNFNTVARAYRQLDKAGLVSTHHGRGTYVLALRSEKSRQQAREVTLKELTRHYLSESARLGYSVEEVMAEMKAQTGARAREALPSDRA